MRSLAIVVLLVVSGAPSFAGGNKALLIGISQYADPEMNDLAYADEDVKTFGSILKEFADYRQSDMQMLLNTEANKKNIVDTIVNVVKDSQKHPLDHFLLMYAGHGLPSTIASAKTNAFLAPHDAYLNQFFPEGTGDLLGNETFINKAWLIRQLSAMNAKNVIIILDSCYSGAKDFGTLYADGLGFKMEFENGKKGKRGITVVRKKGANPELDRRIAFLASSREDQPSAEYSELRHGALSYTMFKYLEDVRNDTEVGQDKPVTVDDMFTGIEGLFDTVEVNGQALGKVHQPVLVPLPDYDDVKGMRFVTMRGLKPKPQLIASNEPPPAPPEEAPKPEEPKPEAAPAPPPPKPKTGQLYIDTGEDQCEVRIDGQKAEQSSNNAFELPPGRHLIALYLSDTDYNHTEMVDVKADQAKRLTVGLRGRLEVEARAKDGGATPAMDVYLDNRSVGKAALVLKSIVAGTHKLTVVTAGVEKSREVEIRPDSPLLVRYTVVLEPGQKKDTNNSENVTF